MYAAKTRSLLMFEPVGFEQLADVHRTLRPPAITSPLLEIQAWVPVRTAASLMTIPYCVPEVRVTGEAKTNVLSVEEPLPVPETVDEARRPPAVITGKPALVVRSSRVMLGLAHE